MDCLSRLGNVTTDDLPGLIRISIVEANISSARLYFRFELHFDNKMLEMTDSYLLIGHRPSSILDLQATFGGRGAIVAVAEAFLCNTQPHGSCVFHYASFAALFPNPSPFLMYSRSCYPSRARAIQCGFPVGNSSFRIRGVLPPEVLPLPPELPPLPLELLPLPKVHPLPDDLPCRWTLPCRMSRPCPCRFWHPSVGGITT
jgi:hypothetical protein